MANILTVPGGYTRISSMLDGINTNDTITPDMGVATREWPQDTDYWGKSGDVCASSASGGITSSGSNGKTHSQNYKVGTVYGHYLSTEIKGFKFRANQDSGAGRGMYVRRFGFRLRKKTTTSSILYDAGGILSRGNYGDKYYDHQFSSDIYNNYLSKGWCFDEFWYNISSEGGSGSRDSTVKVFGFEFNYATSSGKRLILPVKRRFQQRNDYIIAN
jgi:hypothetical protein